MGRFLEQEKKRLVPYKLSTAHISAEAKEPGVYRRKAYPFCQPRELSAENVYSGFRDEALDYFNRNGIKWHDAIDRKPSNHLCDSQVCSVNFLFAFHEQPEALAALLQPVYPELRRMLPVEDGQYVAFEWIGAENYLGEKMARNQKRTRGANYTSADAAVYFERMDGLKQFVLIEWKYTESYSPTWLKFASSGTDRKEIYWHLYDRDDCPIDKNLLGNFDYLFYEPFYQLMRQQFLAHEMERAGELGADRVSLLHLSPAANQDFKKVTSPQLEHLGDSPTRIWAKLMRGNDRFAAWDLEGLFGNFEAEDFPELKDWFAFLVERYAWVRD